MKSEDPNAADAIIRLGRCTVDAARRVVQWDDGRRIRLTGHEAGAFAYLAQRAHTTVEREDLLEHVWEYKRDLITRAVDNTIARLRAKIEEDTSSPAYLLTLRGKGYSLALPQPEGELDPEALFPLRSHQGGAAAPQGQVTIATALVSRADARWQAAPQVMAEATEAADRILRAALAEVDGYEVRSDTSGFMAAFPASAAAAAWAVAAQRDLGAHPWPAALDLSPGSDSTQGGLICMGLDLGEPMFRRDPVTGRMEYFGPMVNRAAQLARLARPGEVLATAALAEAAGTEGSVHWQTLGAHELVPGSGQTTAVVQLGHDDLPECALPPLGQAGTHRTNLPQSRHGFIGRDADVERLAQIVGQGARWVTVSGPAGVGKSRLVQETGRVWLADCPGGVWCCDMAAAHGLEDLVGGVAQTIGKSLHGSAEEASTELGRSLAELGRTVLVLDNHEALVESCTQALEEWLDLAPELQLVITSRVQCQTEHEQVCALAPMSQEEGVQLLEARARDGKRGWVLDGQSRETAEEIVRALDGIPFAIELAAARLPLLGPEALLKRLSDRFTVLRSTAKRVETRHSTLWDAIDWSWQLLSAAEQEALAQSSIFDGGFDLDAAESVIGLPDDVESVTVLDALESLRAQSLLDLTESPLAPGQPRLGLLSSVAAYARQKRQELDPEGEVASRHLAYFQQWLEPIKASIGQADAEKSLSHLALELPNLLVAFAHATKSSPDAAVELMSGMRSLFFLRGPRHRTTGLIARLPLERLSPKRRATCLTFRALSRMDETDWDGAGADLARALKDAETTGEASMVGYVRRICGDLARHQEDGDTATVHFEAALELARSSGDWANEVRILRRLGLVAKMQGDVAKAEGCYLEAIAGAEAQDATTLAAGIGSSLGNLLMENGDLDGAQARFEALLQVSTASSDEVNAATAMANLGLVCLERGQHEDALRQLNEARDRVQILGHKRVLAEIEEGIARVHKAMESSS